jgi:uncharacterized damage-inducible protein DinB
VTFIRIGTVYTPAEIRYNPRIMAKSDPLEILLPFDQWATAQVLETCAKLSEEQWHQKFEIGPGSLYAAATHILGAMQTWTASLAGRQPGPRVEEDGQRRSSAELTTLLQGASRELAEQAQRRPLGEMITRNRQGKTIQLTRGAVLMQVLTHGVHHRAQCLNMLRRLGVTPLPPSSVTEWAIRMDSAG